MVHLEKYKKKLLFFLNLVVDSWGNFPSGVLNKNLHDLGSFSECFHIQRNGTPYETQYCIAKLPRILYGYYSYILVIEFHLIVFYMRVTKISIFVLFFSVVLGICLPAACTVNDANSTKVNPLAMRIPKKTCQVEETITDWNAIDFAVL